MEGLETPYDVEVEIDFIDCTICNKTIRGEALYKIHLTTAGHMKVQLVKTLRLIQKEEALVTKGHAVRDHNVPDFEDILQYLRYLNLDEPIIGLNHLEEVLGSDANDPQPGPRYFCRLCSLEANLPNMVNHIIGRKHRQKYLMTQRQDLVTWDQASVSNQPSKVIRAKAEVVERQDGPGAPKPMRKSRNEGKSNISRVQPKKKGHKNTPADFQADYIYQCGHPLNEPNEPPFHQNDMWREAEQEDYLGGRPHLQDFPKKSQRDYFTSNDNYNQELTESSYCDEFQEDFVEDGYRRYGPEAGGTPKRDYMEKMSHGENYNEHTYPVEAPPYRKPYQETDVLKQFYSEEVRRGRVHTAEAGRRPYPSLHEPEGPYPDDKGHGYTFQPEDAPPHRPVERARGQAFPPRRGSTDYPSDIGHFEQSGLSALAGDSYPSDSHRAGYPGEGPPRPIRPEREQQFRGSLDREPGRYGSTDGACSQRSADPETRRTMMDDSDPSYDKDHLFQMVRALRQKRGPSQVDGMGDPGPSRNAPLCFQRETEGTRVMSDIPEPFRRFLEGGARGQDCKKRKSRFSDATQEDLERSKALRVGADGFPTFKGRAPLRQQVHESQRRDLYSMSQSQYQPDSYPQENFESLEGNTKDNETAFELLKNIEIENGEEADFLKNRLCSLLKEFQAKKSEMTVLKNQGPAVVSRDYNHRGEELEGSQAQNERRFRGRPIDNQPRGSQEHGGWEERERLPPEGFPDYSHPDTDVSSRRRYEEVFGSSNLHQPQHAPYPEEPPMHPERFQEPVKRYDYPAAEHLDPRSPDPTYNREQGYGMQRGPRHSSSLDKITSTLLELVARK